MSAASLPDGRHLQDALASRVRGLTMPREASPVVDRVPHDVQAAVRRALEHGDTHYTSRPGVVELRTVLVNRLAALGLPVSSAETDVVVTAGREEALFVIALALRASRMAVRAEGLEAGTRDLMRLVDIVMTDVGDPTDAGGASLIDLGSRLFTVGEPRVDLRPSGTWAAFGDLDGVRGLASFRVGFAAGDRAIMAGVRTWKQALSICTAAPSQRAALAALANEGAVR